jgi:hypothetical protein
MPSWPVTVPTEVVQDTFRVVNITRKGLWTEMEDGPPLGRKSGTGRRATLAYRIICETRDQTDDFRDFFEVDCADGTARFTMPVWSLRTGTYVTHTCMFDKAEASIEPFGQSWALVFNLIVFDWN